MTNRNEPHTVGEIEAEGIVRAVEIDDDGGGTFKLLLDNGDTLTAPFSSKDDMIITQALREHRRMRLHIIGEGEFDAVGKPLRILRLEWYKLSSDFSRSLRARVAATKEAQDGKKNSPKSTGSSILKMFEEIHKSAPEGVWNDMPTDLAKNWRDYKYGRKGRKASKQ